MNYPIVFIPGLFGSLGEDIITGTGDFSFGFAEYVYRPFIEMLNTMDYIEGKNLFISYYDWRKPVLESVNKYLLPDIEKVMKKTKSKKVILIGHSLGGLLGRAYITYFKPSKIDKLIMIGTPNLGSVNAYSFWSGGKAPYTKVEDNILYNGLKVAFILYYKLFHNINYIGAIQDFFLVVRDLLPSYEYGDYLFFEKDGIRKYIAIEDMNSKNSFLNLMENRNIDKGKLVNISGSGIYTNREFAIGINHLVNDKWIDGKPIKSYKTINGDGTVTTFSSLADLGTNNIIIKGSHTSILYKSQKHLSSILGRPINESVKIVEERKVEKIYIILVKDCHGINVKTPEDNFISSQETNIMDNRIQVIDLSNNNFCIMVFGDKDLSIELNMKKKDGMNTKALMSLVEEN